MITVTVRYRLPAHINRAACVEFYQNAAPKLSQAPGLISKHFIWNEEGWAGGVYQWRSMDDAQRFHGQAWRDGINARYGMPPEVDFYEVVTIIDNVRGTIDPNPA